MTEAILNILLMGPAKEKNSAAEIFSSLSYGSLWLYDPRVTDITGFSTYSGKGKVDILCSF